VVTETIERPTTPTRGRTRPARLADRAQKCALPAAWGIVILLFGIIESSTFLTTSNFSTILGSQAVLVVLTLALLIPLTAGDYDLSVASILSLSAMTLAILNVQHEWPIGAAILAALAVGAVVGLINGGLIVLLGIDPFIVTLGTATILSGVVLWISNSETISGISTTLTDAVITNRFLGVPLGFYYGLALCVVIWYVLEFMAVGRRLLFVGRGRSVARLSGVRVGRLRWGAFVASGTIAAFAGVLYAGTSGAADTTSAASFLLPAYAAAFLGATSIKPGRFNAWGSFIAVYFLVTGITGLQLHGVPSFVQELFYGGALVIAVALSQIARRREAVSLGPGS
jgi:ribose transport system permease protein